MPVNPAQQLDFYRFSSDEHLACYVAERDAIRLREQLEQREEEVEVLRGEVLGLRKEREDVRGRVEKMLKQIDAMVEVEQS